MPKFNEWIFGKSSSVKKKDVFDPGQKNIHNAMTQLLGQGGNEAYGEAFSHLRNLLGMNEEGEESFNNFAAPYKQQFEEEILPGIAERFGGGFGANSGALSSSGFAQALGGAGAQYGANLAQLREGLRMQALQGIMGQYQQNLSQRPFAYMGSQGSGGAMLPLMQAGIAGLASSGNGGGGGGGGGGGNGALSGATGALR